MLYHFKGMELGYTHEAFKQPDPEGYQLSAFKKVYTEWNNVFSPMKDGAPSISATTTNRGCLPAGAK